MRSHDYEGKCGTCEFKRLCGGCRARSYFYYNDYMAHEPWCAHGRDEEE